MAGTSTESTGRSDRTHLNTLVYLREDIDRISRTLEALESELHTGPNNTSCLVHVSNIPGNPGDAGTSYNKRRFCESVKEFGAISTLHGLPNISTAKQNWLRLYWIVLMTVGFGVAVWQSFWIFTESFQFPIHTQFEIHSGNVTFPQFTFCNANGYLKSKVLRHPAFKDIGIQEYNYDNYHVIANLTEEDRTVLSHNVTDFLRWSNGSGLLAEIRYTLHSSVLYGNCYVLIPIVTKLTDAAFGIQISVNVNPDEYLTNDAPSVLLFIREPGLFPTTSLDNYIQVQPGYLLEGDISLETITRLGGKYGHCQANEEQFRSETGLTYAQDVCLAICSVERTISDCGCFVKLFVPFPNKYKISNRLKNVPECSASKLDCFYRGQKHLPTLQDCHCKPRCRMKKYRTSVRKSEIPKNDILPQCNIWQKHCDVPSNDTENWVMSNTLVVRLRFADTEHKEFRQVPSYPLSRFLSDLGGTFGLYLGASLLTLSEIPQLLIGYVMFLTKKGK